MRNKIVILLIGFHCFGLTLTAQSPAKRQLVVSVSNGGFVAFKSETSAASSQQAPTSLASLIYSQALAGDNKIIHRVLTDGQRQVIFGYDLWIHADPVARKFSLAVLPAEEAFRRTFLKDSVSRNLTASFATFPRSAAPQTLDDGDTVSLELLVNPESGVKIVDLVRVTFDRSTLVDHLEPQPRDFTLDAVSLSMKGYQLLIDGKLVGQSKSTIGYSGSLLWFYVPGRGRFIFSLVPREGYKFRKAGVLEGNKIEFVAKGEHYEWLSGAEILPNGRWNLWVLDDERYTPMFSSGTPLAQEKKPGLIRKLEDALEKGPIDSVSLGVLGSIRPPPEARPLEVPQRVMVGGADSMEHLIPKSP